MRPRAGTLVAALTGALALVLVTANQRMAPRPQTPPRAAFATARAERQGSRGGTVVVRTHRTDARGASAQVEPSERQRAAAASLLLLLIGSEARTAAIH